VSEGASGAWVQEASGLEVSESEVLVKESEASAKESARELVVPDCRNQNCSGKL
jgi:hypothetical protein